MLVGPDGGWKGCLQATLEGAGGRIGGAKGGGLLALGPFLTPDPAGSSMGLFTSREDAERFIADDPFVVEGLAIPRILEWDPVRFE
jgi:hypothetical protein